MKIVVYFNSMAPAGGIERVISKHIKFLAKDNDIILLTDDNLKSFYELPEKVVYDSLSDDTKLNMNSKVIRLYQVIKSILRSSYKLKKKIQFHKPDVIYVASPLNVFKVALANRSCKNIFVTEHASFQAYNFVYKKIVKQFYKKVSLLTVPTTDDSKYYQSIGISNEYVPNPLSFYPEQQSTLENKIVLNIGRFTDDKQHLSLINSWKLTNERLNGWKLHIYGKGENESKIKDLIVQLDLSESVFLFQPIQDIQNKFLEASIFAMSSRAEGFGLVLAEAMACGVPCVSFNCPTGPKDIIENQRNGILIEQNNEQAFAKALDLLMTNSDLRKRYGAQSRIDIKKFDEDIVGIKINELVNRKFKNK